MCSSYHLTEQLNFARITTIQKTLAKKTRTSDETVKKLNQKNNEFTIKPLNNVCRM